VGRYKMLEKLYSACAIISCAVLLAASLFVSAAARLGFVALPVDGGISGSGETELQNIETPEKSDWLTEIIDAPGEAYALEYYDLQFYTEEGEIPPEGEYKIVARDLAAKSIYEYYNETPYNPDIDVLLAEYNFDSKPAAVYKPLSVTPEPLVLIIHTHGTEGYAQLGATSYSSDNLPRSTNTSQNIVAVGRAMRDELLKHGIPAIHCETMHDLVSYADSYKNSLATVKAYLKKYPSIKYIFDVHRDALISTGTITKCVYEQNGTSVAQVMFVVGTDAGGADYPHWQDNLAFALAAQSLAAERFPGMMRPVSLRRASFNAQYGYRNLLIEVGTCANTLAEAKAAGVQIASVLSELIARGY
jgi:stage II sporulation protein P